MAAGRLVEQAQKEDGVYANWSNVVERFGRAGLPIRLVPALSPEGSHERAREDGLRKRIGLVAAVDMRGDAEIFSLAPSRRARPTVLDVSPRRRHLLLLLTRGAAERRILFGHDERHLFWSILPGAETPSDIAGAFAALQPGAVRKAAPVVDEKGGTPRAIIRQGEWFFIPEPGFAATHSMRPWATELRRAGRRGWGSAHRPDELATFEDESGINRLYARGAVRHPDHATIRLDCWHSVHLNLEEGKPGGLRFLGRAD